MPLCFCTAPGRNVLQPGELLVALVFPPPMPHSGSAYERFIPRNEMDIAVVGVGTKVQLNQACDKIEFARIGLAAVAPTPKFASTPSVAPTTTGVMGSSPIASAYWGFIPRNTCVVGTGSLNCWARIPAVANASSSH